MASARTLRDGVPATLLATHASQRLSARSLLRLAQPGSQKQGGTPPRSARLDNASAQCDPESRAGLLRLPEAADAARPASPTSSLETMSLLHHSQLRFRRPTVFGSGTQALLCARREKPPQKPVAHHVLP